MGLSDVETCLAATEAGAAVIRKAYGREPNRISKSGTDFATQADIDSERAIRAVLDAHRPGDSVLGEELGHDARDRSDRLWLVDPLCGTRNFAANTPLAAVNVALVIDGATSVAASAEPVSGELFWTDGSGAFARRDGIDNPLEPTNSSRLVEINADRPRNDHSVSAQLVVDLAFRAEFEPRILSSTLVVAWVAAGRRAAYVTDGPLLGDLHFAAGIAIAEAAGCVITALNGEPLHKADGAVISADEEVHSAVLRHLAPHLAQPR